MSTEANNYTDNYYHVLRVDDKASEADIKKAYFSLARDAHPDRGGDPIEFKKIAEAYKTLSNPKKRKAFDSALKANPLLFEKESESLGVFVNEDSSPIPASSSGGITHSFALVPYQSQALKRIDLSALIGRANTSVSMLLSWTLQNIAFGLQLLQLPGQLRKQGEKAFAEFLIGFFEQIHQDPETKQFFFDTKSVKFFLKNIEVFSSEILFFANYCPEKTEIFINGLIEHCNAQPVTASSMLLNSFKLSQVIELVHCLPSLAFIVLESSHVPYLTFPDVEYMAASIPREMRQNFIEKYTQIRKIQPEEMMLREMVAQERFTEILALASNPEKNFCLKLNIETVFRLVVENSDYFLKQIIIMLLLRTFPLNEQAITKIIAMDKKAKEELVVMLQYCLLRVSQVDSDSEASSMMPPHMDNAINAIRCLLVRDEPLMVEALLTRENKIPKGAEKLAPQVAMTRSFQEKLRTAQLDAYLFAEQHQLWQQLETPGFMENLPIEKITLWKQIFSGKNSTENIVLSLAELEELLANFYINERVLTLDGDDVVRMHLLTVLSEKIARNIAKDWWIPLKIREFILKQLADPTMPFHTQVADIVLRHADFFLIKKSLLIDEREDHSFISVEWSALINLDFYNRKAMLIFLTSSMLMRLEVSLKSPVGGSNYGLAASIRAPIRKKAKNYGAQKKYTKSKKLWDLLDNSYKNKTCYDLLIEAYEHLSEGEFLETAIFPLRLYQFLQSDFFIQRVQAFQLIEARLPEIISGRSSSVSNVVETLVSAIEIAGYEAAINEKLTEAMKKNPSLIAMVCAILILHHEQGTTTLSTVALAELNHLLLLARNQHGIRVEMLDLELAKSFIVKQDKALSAEEIRAFQENFCEQLPELQTPESQQKLQSQKEITALLSTTSQFNRFHAISAKQLFDGLQQEFLALVNADGINLEYVPAIEDIYTRLLSIPKKELPSVENFIQAFPVNTPHNLLQWLLALANTEADMVKAHLLKLWHRQRLIPAHIGQYSKLRAWCVEASLAGKIPMGSFADYPQQIQELLAIDFCQQIHQQLSKEGFSIENLLLQMPPSIASAVALRELRDSSLQQKPLFEFWISPQSLWTKIDILIDAFKKDWITQPYLFSHLNGSPEEIISYLHRKISNIFQKGKFNYLTYHRLIVLLIHFLRENAVKDVISKKDLLILLKSYLTAESDLKKSEEAPQNSTASTSTQYQLSEEDWSFLLIYLDGCKGSSSQSFSHYKLWLASQPLQSQINSLLDAFKKDWITETFLFSHLTKQPAQNLPYLNQKIIGILQERPVNYLERQRVMKWFVRYLGFLTNSSLTNLLSKHDFLRILTAYLPTKRHFDDIVRTQTNLASEFTMASTSEQCELSKEDWLFLVGYLDDCNGSFFYQPQLTNFHEILWYCYPIPPSERSNVAGRIDIAVDLKEYPLKQLLLLPNASAFSKLLLLFNGIPSARQITEAGFQVPSFMEALHEFGMSLTSLTHLDGKDLSADRKTEKLLKLFFRYFLQKQKILPKNLDNQDTLFTSIISKFFHHPQFLARPLESIALLQDFLSHQFFHNLKKQAALFHANSPSYVAMLCSTEVRGSTQQRGPLRDIYPQDMSDVIIQAIFSTTMPAATASDRLNAVNGVIQNSVFETLTQYRNQYSLFASCFKAFLGILLAIPLCAVPLIFEAYRNYFFAAIRIVIHLHKMQQEVADLQPQQTTKSWIEQRLNESSTFSKFFGRSDAKQAAVNQLAQTISNSTAPGSVRSIVKEWQQSYSQEQTQTNATMVARHRFFETATPAATAMTVQELQRSRLRI